MKKSYVRIAASASTLVTLVAVIGAGAKWT